MQGFAKHGSGYDRAVGACGSREFTVLGNVVNVAFRLNSVGSECGKDLLIGEATAKHWKVISN